MHVKHQSDIQKEVLSEGFAIGLINLHKLYKSKKFEKIRNRSNQNLNPATKPTREITNTNSQNTNKTYGQPSE